MEKQMQIDKRAAVENEDKFKKTAAESQKQTLMIRNLQVEVKKWQEKSTAQADEIQKLKQLLEKPNGQSLKKGDTQEEKINKVKSHYQFKIQSLEEANQKAMQEKEFQISEQNKKNIAEITQMKSKFREELIKYKKQVKELQQNRGVNGGSNNYLGPSKMDSEEVPQISPLHKKRKLGV